jgi:tRNA(Ile)-lysidine synthase
MLAGGELVLVAVSGGADSVALLHVLHSLSSSWRLRLHVGHVDHRLRPESAREADTVRALARRLGLPVDVIAVDVPAGGSLEAAARVARYRALEGLADRIGADRIAVAHTGDDQAETVVMRALEGAGPRGLAGIPPVRGRIIRPLIDVRRSDVVAELRGLGLEWIEDPSNRDPRFTRNRIRHELMPELARLNPDVVRALGRTARLARRTVEALERVAASELADAVVEPDAIRLRLARLAALPRELGAEVLRQAAIRLGAPGMLRAWAQTRLRRVLADPPPRPWRLGAVVVEVSEGWVRVARSSITGLAPRALEIPGATGLPEIGRALNAMVLDGEGYVVPRGPRVAAFDADVLPRPLIVRHRRPGDRFTPFGGAEVRLKRFLIAAKVPRWERDAVPIVEAGGRIAWVAGHRRGDAAPITARTRRVLELSLV